MKRAGLVYLVVVPAVLWGCVLSVTPDTSETIVLDPGETLDLAVKTTGIGGYERSYYIVDVSDPDVPLSNTIEQNNFSSVIDDGSQVNVDTAPYTPNEESAGEYTILYAVVFGTPSTEMEMIMLKIMKATYCQLWQVVVRGVAILPKENTAAVAAIRSNMPMPRRPLRAPQIEHRRRAGDDHNLYRQGLSRRGLSLRVAAGQCFCCRRRHLCLYAHHGAVRDAHIKRNRHRRGCGLYAGARDHGIRVVAGGN